MHETNVALAGPVKMHWGWVGGKEVFLYRLENKRGLQLVVSNFGAAAQALFVPDKNGQLGDVLLGYDNLQDYVTDEVYMGTVVGRYANRIAGDTVTIERKKYRLPVREGGYHLHGGVEGFNKKIFEAELYGNGTNSLCFHYRSPHLEEGFPGNLSLTVTYTLTDNNEWCIEYECVTDRTTIVNLTQHAYFNLSGQVADPILDHFLQIDSNTYLPVNEMQVPTGELAPVANTPFDFTTLRRIGERIHSENRQLLLSGGYDHSWVLKTTVSEDLVHAATVIDTVSGRRLDVHTTEPALHFYSGNFLNQLSGKNEAVYGPRSGFCLETQHYPDAPNHPHFPSTVLKAGERFYSKTVYAFSVGKQLD